MIKAKTLIHKKPRVKNKIRMGISVSSVIIFIILILYSVSLLLPLLWGFVTSFKDDFTFMMKPFGLPDPWLYQNYLDALTKFKVSAEYGAGTRQVYMPEMFLNSVLYAGGCAFTATLIPCVTAYMTAKYPYKFSKLITTVVIVCMILPIVGALPSEILVATKLGLYDRIWGMWIMKANFLGLYFLVFQNVFKGVPAEFTEAAKIDGASHFRIFLQIMMPLAKNVFFTVLLLKFIEFWNDYQTPLRFIPNRPTVAYGMFTFEHNYDNDLSTPPMRFAGAMLLLIPILIVFLALHKRFMGNLTMGGIKG